MRLSIITVNYNNIDGLRRTISSVLSQTWHDYEWLIIDGGSSDGSKELIEQTALICPNISFWCSEPDKGVYNAMNKGISKSQGDYLNFLNSGDCYADKETLNCLSRAYDDNADIYYGDADFYDRNGHLFMEMRLPKRLTPILYLNGGNISHQASFIKRPLLYNRPYDESYKLAADGEFFFYALLHNCIFKHIPYVIIVSDIPGLSGDVQLSQKEKSRLVVENMRRISFLSRSCYKLRRIVSRTLIVIRKSAHKVLRKLSNPI